MTLCFDAWNPLTVGEQVIVRERATALESIVTVRRLLEPLEGEGPGFVDDTGSTYRNRLHSARRVAGTDILQQHTVDEVAIHALSTRRRHAQRHVPDADVARQAVVATITAVKDAARREQLTPAVFDRIANELTRTETNLSPA